MLVSENLGVLAVSTTRLFPLNFILGRGMGKIECPGMLALIK